MSFSSLKRKFYKIYNQHYEFLSELEENRSGTLTILYCSHLLLDAYFNGYDDPDFLEDIIEYFSDEDELNRVIEFFKDRIEYIEEVYNEHDEDTLEELAPVMFYMLNLKEVLDKYEEELEDKGVKEKLENTINNLNSYIKEGKNITDEMLEDVELQYHSYSTYVDIDDVLSMDIMALYDYLNYDPDEDDEEYFDEDESIEEFENIDGEMSLGFLKTTIDMFLGHVSKEFGEELLSLKRDSYIYKEIIRYKKILDKCAFVCEAFQGELSELNDRLNIEFPAITLLSTGMYFNSVKLISNENSYLKVESLSKEEFIQYKKFVHIASILDLLGASAEDSKIDDDIDNAIAMIIDNIYEKNISEDELDFIYKDVTSNFLKTTGSRYSSIDELLDDTLQKLSHISNEYY